MLTSRYVISETTNFDSSKAHGGDMISIRMLKLYDQPNCKPLNIILKSCLTQGISHQNGKNANVPIYKKTRGAAC